MKRCTVILLAILFSSVFPFKNLFAQEPINNPFQPPVFTQTSPEVAAFTRYGDIPVSLYTGVPDISIPLHTIKMKDMTVPISLSYHAGGITVDQEATSVGLGWSLIAGGTITVSPVGGRDIPGMPGWSPETINYIKANNPWIIAGGNEDWYSNFGCMEPNPFRQTDEESLHYATKHGQGEPDIHTVSLPHRTFKFYLRPGTNEAIFIGEKNKCEIVYSGWNFFITDEFGVKYSFTVYEEDAISRQPSIWYLTRIEDVNRNEINFEYQTSQYAIIGGTSLRFYERMVLFSPNQHFPVPAARGFSVAGDGVPGVHLNAIRTNTEEIVFTYQEGRKDGGSRLKDIKILDRSSGGVRKYYRLNHGYFESSNVGAQSFNNHYDPYPAGAAWDSRLKLQNLAQVNPSVDDDTLAFIFSYDERYQLPPKSTFAKDFWGYYNGQENASSAIESNGHTLLPDPRVMEHIQPDFAGFNWKGWFWTFDDLKFANRFSARDYITTGMLKSITYPGGGRTEFEFEPHTFHNQKMFEASDQAVFLGRDTAISVSDMNDPYGLSEVSKPFTLSETSEVSLSGGGDSTLYNLSGGSIGIIDLNGGGENHMYSLGVKSRWDVKLTLPAGSYRLVCGAPSNIPFQNYQVIVWARVEYRIYDRDSISTVINRAEGLGGGLRIKTIVNYDEDNEVVQTKVYRYENEGGGTSGRMLRRMDNFRLEPMRYGWLESCSDDCERERTTQADVPTFYADNVLPVHNATSNAMVGYDRVVVKMISEIGDNGKEISYFHNEVPPIQTAFDLYDVCTNGSLKQQVLLDSDSDTVKRVRYFYGQHHYAKYWHNMKVEDRYTGPIGCVVQANPFAFIGRYNIIAYAYTNFVNHVVKTDTYDYSGDARLLVRSDNFYDTTNYQLDEVKTLTSTNGLRISRYTYPHDYPGDFAYPVIVGKNMINPVIEQREYLDDKLLKTQENKLWLWFNSQHVMTIAPSRVKIGFSENPVEDKILFDKYDLQGNVLQYHLPDDNLFTVVCRDYGDNRVVAVVIGELTYDQVRSIAGTYLDQLDDNLSKVQLESVNTSIRSLLPDALVTTYTYDPVYGLTSETDPNGMTTYYEYDAFGRLALVRDDEGNILKHVEYHYQK